VAKHHTTHKKTFVFKVVELATHGNMEIIVGLASTSVGLAITWNTGNPHRADEPRSKTPAKETYTAVRHAALAQTWNTGNPHRADEPPTTSFISMAPDHCLSWVAINFPRSGETLDHTEGNGVH
jgi:hypothetical protein